MVQPAARLGDTAVGLQVVHQSVENGAPQRRQSQAAQTVALDTDHFRRTFVLIGQGRQQAPAEPLPAGRRETDAPPRVFDDDQAEILPQQRRRIEVAVRRIAVQIHTGRFAFQRPVQCRCRIVLGQQSQHGETFGRPFVARRREDVEHPVHRPGCASPTDRAG